MSNHTVQYKLNNETYYRTAESYDKLEIAALIAWATNALIAEVDRTRVLAHGGAILYDFASVLDII